MLKNSTRKSMENLIYRVFSAMDPTGKNTEKYKEKFKKMNDKQFESFMVHMFNDHRSFLILEMETYVNEPTMDTLDNAAKELGIDFYETVCFPHMSTDPNKPFTTRFPVPVGFLHCKRLQQMKRKKNSTSTSIESRDVKTGQVVGKDKNSRSSDVENYAMMSYGAREATKEFMSFRSDDLAMKTEAYSSIYKDGYVDMNELTNDPMNKKTLNTFNVYMICMGLMTDLVDQGYVLQSTIDDKNV